VEVIKNLKRSRFEVYWLVLPTVAIMVFVLAYPILYSISNSLKDPQEDILTLRNYRLLFRNYSFINSIIRTFIFVSLSTLGAYVIGLISALILARLKSNILGSVFSIPWIFPWVVVAFTWRFLYHSEFGILNRVLMQLGITSSRIEWLALPSTVMYALSVANVWKLFPFVTLCLLASIKAIPKEQYEAAVVDGANEWKQTLYITIPNLRTMSYTTVTLVYIMSMNAFSVPWIMTQGGPADLTEVISIYIYNTAFSRFRFETAMAAGVLIIIFQTVVLFLLLKIVKGRSKKYKGV